MPIKVNISQATINTLKRNLVEAEKELKLSTASGCREFVETVMAESLEEVPVETGALAESQFITETTTEDGEPLIEFGYGVDNVQYNPRSKVTTDEYMVRQHEDMALNHPNGGKAKFLEDPITRNSRNLIQVLSDKVLDAFSKVFGRGK